MRFERTKFCVLIDFSNHKILPPTSVFSDLDFTWGGDSIMVAKGKLHELSLTFFQCLIHF